MEDLTNHDNELITLKESDITLEISHLGEIVGLKKGDLQLIHGGGKEERFKKDTDLVGWKRSEILMFPIVGPAGNYMIGIDDCEKRIEIPMDQHGISRYIPFKTTNISRKNIALVQEYSSGSEIINLKHNDNEGKERPKVISWPYSFSIEKNISLHAIKSHDDFAGYCGFVDIDFNIMNMSENIMPFMLGFHPAFRTYGIEGNIQIEQGESAKEIVLDGFLGKDLTLFHRNTGSIFFKNSRFNMRIDHDFGNTMVWSPKGCTEMVCIEPVTSLPKTLENSGYCLQVPKFEFILPNKIKTYNTRIFF